MTSGRETEAAVTEGPIPAPEPLLAGLEGFPLAAYLAAPGLDGRWAFVTSHIHALVGFTPDEWCAETLWASRLHPDDRERVLQEEAEQLATRDNELWTREYRLLHRDGSIVWVRDQARLESGPGGRTSWFRGILADITERKRAEDSLAQAHRLLGRLLDDLPGIAYQMTLGARPQIEFVSDGVERVIGVSADDLMRGRRGWLDRVLPEDRGRMLEVIRREVAAGRSFEVVYRVVGPADRPRWVMDRGHGELVAGRPVIKGFAWDITELVEARMMSDRSLGLLEATLEATADGIIVFDTAGCQIVHNKRFGELFGEVEAGSLGEGDLWRLLGDIPEDGRRAKLERAWEQEAPGGEWHDTIRNPDGRVLEVVARAQRWTGKVIGRVYSVRDVTERADALEGLRDREGKLARIQAMAQLGAWEWDVVSDRRWWSEELFHIHGVDPASFVPSLEGFLKLVHPEDRERVAEVFKHAFTTAEPFMFRHRIARPDGRIRLILGSGEVITDADGRCVRMQGFCQDITAVEMMQAELFQMRKMEAIGQLAAGVAHDLNNLIASIHGNAELLAESTSGDDPVVEDLREAAGLAARIVSRLLDFGSTDRRAGVELDLNMIVEGARPMLRWLLPPAMSLEVQLAGTPVWVSCDQDELVQVLVNLVTNARDAIAGAGRVTVRVSHADMPENKAVLDVIDDGSGMDEATARRVFEPFFTTKHRLPGRGVGLGMATVHGVAIRRRWSISIHTAPGEGTTVSIEMPVIERRHASPPDRDGDRSEVSVLVVDDDEFLGAFSAEVLSEQGFRVIQETGNAAMSDPGLGGRRVDMALIDLALAQVDPQRLEQRLKQAHPGIRVAFTSQDPSRGTAVPRLVSKPLKTSWLDDAFGKEGMRARLSR